MNKTLALLVRALRTESRDIKSHLVRGALVLAILFLFMANVSAMQYETAPGRTMFLMMTWANWALITFAGGAVFSVAISEETEQQTLGLLRMANIGPLSLLLGKWLPRLFTAILLVSAQFPFTWLTITLGGVSWEQIGASYMLLLAHLFFVGNLALFCSVWRPDNTSAGVWTFSLLAVWRFGPLLLWGITELLNEMSLIPQSWASYVGACAETQNRWTASGRLILDVVRTSFQGSIWSEQVISNFAIGAGFFLLTWLCFDRLTMSHLSGGPARKSIWTQLLTIRKRQSRPVWDWAIGWKDYVQVAGGGRGIVIKLTLYAVITGIIILVYSLNSYSSRQDHMPEVVGGGLAWFIIFIFLPFELCATAAKLFRPELKDQTWSTLLTLPMSLPEIAYSKLAGAFIGLLPTLCVLALAVTPFLTDFLSALSKEPGVILGIGYALTILLLLLHAITYFSVTVSWAATPMAIILGVVATGAVQLIPWFFFGLMMLGVGGSGGEGILYLWMMMLSIGNLFGTGLVHFGIGKQLEAKGAAS